VRLTLLVLASRGLLSISLWSPRVKGSSVLMDRGEDEKVGRSLFCGTSNAAQRAIDLNSDRGLTAEQRSQFLGKTLGQKKQERQIVCGERGTRERRAQIGKTPGT